MTALLKTDGTLDLNAIKTHLGMQLHDIVRRHDKIDAHLKNIDREMPDDWQEAAQLMQNDEVLEGLETNSRARILGLRHALERIKAGTYGTCANCAETINPRRLAAMPMAAVCVACAAG